MSLATSNRDGGRTDQVGHLRSVSKSILGEVLTGLNITQRGAGANMSVDVAVGDAVIKRSDGTYGHPAWNDATLNQVIAAADGSNPRRDIIVMYIDYNVTPSTGVANNTNGVVAIKSVAGTAAGSPVDPTSVAIQASVGSGNPWIRLARVRVGAGVTSISNSVIDDLRQLAVGLAQGGWIYDNIYSWVYGSSTTFTVAGVDVTAQFPVGTKLRVMQSGSIKYFTVTASVFSTNTTVTVDGNTTYSLTNVPIDIPAYSYSYIPQGFPRRTLLDKYAGYDEIGRTTLGSNSASPISVASLPTYRYLVFIFNVEATGGTLDTNFTVNGDGGTNYNITYQTSLNGAPTAGASLTSIPVESGQTDSGQQAATIVEVVGNRASEEKLLFYKNLSLDAAGAATAPSYLNGYGKWANTSVVITRVDLNASAGTFAAGSEVIVLGKN